MITIYINILLAGRASDSLLKVELQIVDNQKCFEGYTTDSLLGDGILDSQICAGDTTGIKDTCQVNNNKIVIWLKMIIT